MTMRGACPTPFAAWCPATQPSHFCRKAVRRAWRLNRWCAHASPSMKASFDGSRSSWPSNQSWRRFRTSGRSCSSACADFFERPAPSAQPNTQPAAADDDTSILTQPGDHLVQGDVLARLDHRHDKRFMGVQPRAAWLTLPTGARAEGNLPTTNARPMGRRLWTTRMHPSGPRPRHLPHPIPVPEDHCRKRVTSSPPSSETVNHEIQMPSLSI